MEKQIDNKYSQANIAKILGVTQGNVSYIFKGEGPIKQQYYQLLTQHFPQLQMHTNDKNDTKKIKNFFKANAKKKMKERRDAKRTRN